MIFNVSSNSNHSMILWFYSGTAQFDLFFCFVLFGWCCCGGRFCCYCFSFVGFVLMHWDFVPYKDFVRLLVILKSQELRAEKECEFKVSAAQELHITLCLCFRCLLVLGIRISWSVVKPQQFGKVQEIKAWQPPCPLMLHRSNVSTAILGIRDYKLAEENNIVSL